MENCKNHDHTKTGTCLVMEWKGACCNGAGHNRYQSSGVSVSKKEQEEYIKSVNKINRAKVVAANSAPF